MPPGVKHALRAIFWGSLAGGGPFSALFIFFGFEAARDSSWDVLVTVLLPLAITASVIIAAFLLLGLPLTALLRHRQQERRNTYAIVAMCAGLIVPVIITLVLLGEYWFEAIGLLALPGGLAGFVTGWVWGGWRERQAAIDPAMLRDAFE